MSNKSRRDRPAADRLADSPEPNPFTPAEFAAWRGMLRVHSTVMRALDRRFVRAMDGIMTNSQFTAGHVRAIYGARTPIEPCHPGVPLAPEPPRPDRPVQPERYLPRRRQTRARGTRRANHEPRRRAQPACRPDRSWCPAPARGAGHPSRHRPRARARSPRRARHSDARRGLGKGDARHRLKPRLAALRCRQRPAELRDPALPTPSRTYKPPISGCAAHPTRANA